MTILKAIKKLVTAWGGTSTADTIADAIDDLVTVAPSAAELPTVSSTDNGDILKVVSGAWAKGDPELPAGTATNNGQVLGVSEGAWAVVDAPSGGGSGKLTVTEQDSKLVIDASYADITASVTNGVIPWFVYDGTIYTVIKWFYDSEEPEYDVYFATTAVDQGHLIFNSVTAMAETDSADLTILNN